MSTGISNQHYMYMNQAFQDTEATHTSAAEGTVPVVQDEYSKDCSSTDTKKPRHMNSLEKLKNFLKEHNIKSDSIKHIISKYTGNSDSTNINTLDLKSCDDLQRELEKYIEFEKILKNYNLDPQDLFGTDNIFSLNLEVIENANRNLCKKNSENMDPKLIRNRMIKYYYCDILGIKISSIKDSNLENFLKAAKKVIEKMSNGEIKSTEEARLKVLDYTVALNYNWDEVEDFDKFNSNNSDNLIHRLRIAKLLNPNKKKYSKDEIQKACKKYFNLFKYLKKPKKADPNLTEEQWRCKLLRQTIGKLIINTYHDCKGSDREYLIPIIESIEKEYRSEAVTNAFILANGDSEAQRKLANEVLTSETLPEDVDNEVIEDASSKADKAVVETFTKEQAEKLAAICKETGLDYNELENKINNNIELNESEAQAVKRAGILSAALIGVQQNNNIDEKSKENIGVSVINTVSETEAGEKLLLKKIDDRINSRTDISDNKKKDLEKYFNLISNNNYTLVKENPDCKLNEPITIEELEQRRNNSTGIKPREDVNVSESQNVVTELQQTIKAQTNVDGNREEAFVVEPTETTRKSDNTPATVIPHTTTASVVSELLHNVQTISVTDIRDFSIGLTPLLKQFSELATSVQNHIKTRLESRSEDEQVRSIDQMDRNSDKVDLALQLKISDDKLEELHLDTNARKNLELQEYVA